MELRNSWGHVPEDLAAEFEKILAAFPVKRDISRAENIYALYGKGLALVKMGRRTDGAREFQELANRFPKNALAAQACSQVTSLGYRCTAPTAPATRTSIRRSTTAWAATSSSA